MREASHPFRVRSLIILRVTRGCARFTRLTPGYSPSRLRRVAKPATAERVRPADGMSRKAGRARHKSPEFHNRQGLLYSWGALMSLQISKRLFTVHDYHRMVDAGILSEDDRVELIRGEIIAMSPIGPRHSAAVLRANQFLVKA